MLGLRGPSGPRPGLLGGRMEAAARAAITARAAIMASAFRQFAL